MDEEFDHFLHIPAVLKLRRCILTGVGIWRRRKERSRTHLRWTPPFLALLSDRRHHHHHHHHWRLVTTTDCICKRQHVQHVSLKVKLCQVDACWRLACIPAIFRIGNMMYLQIHASKSLRGYTFLLQSFVGIFEICKTCKKSNLGWGIGHPWTWGRGRKETPSFVRGPLA